MEGWTGVAIATLFVLTTALCGLSLGAHGARRSRRLAAAEANHVVMGVAMILMAAPLTADLVVPGVGVLVFGVAAAGWLGVLLTARLLDEPLGSVIGRDRCTGHPVHLLLVNAAMVAMYVAMLPGGGHAHGTHEMPGMAVPETPAPGITPVPVVAGLLALYLVGHAIATAVVVVRRAPCHEAAPLEPTDGPVAVAARPVRVLAHGRVQLVGQAGMGVAMAAMLLLGV
ncbi:DUF5134 domain-containing protein [Actinomycetospora soli]|uniref:DUF5134 domain-containing protein n=1 Tax=Actinomycetospora soli TaxID=2893887 RepID=UPI001E36836A|nr:DUF5134 domain-containing protein [Actinomycetospora soli]MCD2188941.1 DUF5134 domain-containing protein [Actinomycetospora soli]